jgi:hypothetical protein
MTFRAISELFPSIIARAEAMHGFQDMLNRCPTAEGRKALILSAWERLAIDDEDAELLLQAYGLETA